MNGRSPESPLLVARGVGRSFVTPAGVVEVLHGLSLALDRGAALAVVGPSGSGKSTLLQVLGALDPPTTGAVTIAGVDPYRLPEAELARLRNRSIGFVFQEHYLLPQLSALDNVLLPAWATASPSPAAQERGRQLLRRVGLEQRLDHRPAQLSGGERQRVALARALLMAPSLLLCDEPTGSLDGATAEVIGDLLLELQQEAGVALVVVTHSPALAARCGRRVELVAGRLAA
jgi:lipoprotein-releasing system ATP-binding protein